MSKKIQVILSEDQQAGLNTIMREDLQSNVSAYIGLLIGQEVARRNKKNPVGRPRKNEPEDEYEEEPDYTHDLPKTIPHYGRMIGQRELADILEQQKLLK